MISYTPSISEEAYTERLESLASDKRLRADNIELPEGSTNALSRVCLFAGAAGLILTVIGGLAVGAKHAEAAYHAAVMAALAPCIGALMLIMIFQLLNTTWNITVRRQFEHLARLAPWVMLLLIPTAVFEVISGGTLFSWIGAEGHLASEKAPFLNVQFWIARAILYWVVIFVLSQRLTNASLEQDRTGNRWLTAKMRRTSAWGIPALALTLSFLSFDWLMSVDSHFFSTMWGVYYFAACAGSALAVVALVTVGLRASGRLTGVVTPEHDHDHAKLMFAFVVFWAYIFYSQYFLIWYSNIPEETAFMNIRKSGGWETAFYILIAGHFVMLFLFLLPRTVKRTAPLFAAAAFGLVLIHIFDMFWIIRPEVYAHDAWNASLAPGLTAAQGKEAYDAFMADTPGVFGWWVDVVAVIGVMGVFASMLLRRVSGGVLIPIKDPRLPRSLSMRNYV